MPSFNRRRGQVKPALGARLIGGHWAPNVLAIPFNELTAAGWRNYAKLRGSNALNAVTSPTAGVGLSQDKHGVVLNISSSAGNVSAVIASATDIWPTESITILAGYRKTDTTNRQSQAFGNPGGGSDPIQVRIPYADGVVYWDFGGGDGSHRTSYAGGSNFSQYSVWAFTSGLARGREIWRDGVIVGTNASTSNRSATMTTFVIGAGDNSGFNNSDLANYDFIYMWDSQLPMSVIQELSLRPFAVFQPYRPQIFGVTVAVATGDLSVTLDGATISAAGTAPAAGTLSATLAALTGSAAGTAPVGGSLTKTLGSLTDSGAGSAPVGGSLVYFLDYVTLSGAGSAPVTGFLNKALDDATLLANGGPENRGVLSSLLDDVTLAAAGSAPITGSLNKTLGALTLDGQGTIPVTGNLSKALAPVTILADGTEAGNNIGFLAVTLQDVTLVAMGIVRREPTPPWLVAGRTRGDFWQTHDFPEML